MKRRKAEIDALLSGTKKTLDEATKAYEAARKAHDTAESKVKPELERLAAVEALLTGKLAREAGGSGARPDEMSVGMDHSKIGQMTRSAAQCGPSVISLPYEFPTAGDYRIWVQFKTGGQVLTAVFDTSVAGM